MNTALGEIEEPVLFVTGQYDEARPQTMFKYQNLSKNEYVEIIDDVANMIMIDQPQKMAVIEHITLPFILKSLGHFLNNLF